MMGQMWTDAPVEILYTTLDLTVQKIHHVVAVHTKLPCVHRITLTDFYV